MLGVIRALILVYFFTIMLPAAELRAPSQPESQSENVVTVCVGAGGGLQREVLSQGMAFTEEMFNRIGVRLKWSCSAPPDAPPAVVVRVDNEMPRHVSRSALAFARPYALRGVRVVISWDRLQPFLSAHPSSAGIILGGVLAHELGHVLSRSDYHDAHGLMSAKWAGDDLHAIEFKPLAFSPEESRYIHEGLQSIEAPDTATQGVSAVTVFANASYGGIDVEQLLQPE